MPTKMRAKFNDTSDPSYEFKDQCVAYRRVCPLCGTRFKPEDTECPGCGAPRPRCKNRAMAGEEFCRTHMPGRPFSLYSKLAATLTDTTLEEFIECNNTKDLEQEFALARLALSGALDESKLTSKVLMHLVKQFFEIAEKKHNIEKGQTLNISWNDELANVLRKRVRVILKAMADVIEEKVTDENLRKEILIEIRNRTKMWANDLTAPPDESYYKES